MAFGDPYATVADFVTSAQRELSATEIASVSALLDAASRVVENFTGRQFNKGTAVSARRFRAVDPQRLPVDDFYTTTGLAITANSTAWAVADVEARPWDGIYKGQPGWPFSELIAVSKIWPGPSRTPKVTITANWGWAAVPTAIKQATLDVAQMMFSSGGGPGVVQSLSVEDYRVSYASPGSGGTADVPSELMKAAPYRRVKFGVA